MARVVVPVIELDRSGVAPAPVVQADPVQGNVVYQNDGTVWLEMGQADDTNDAVIIIETPPHPEGDGLGLDNVAVEVQKGRRNLLTTPSSETATMALRASSSNNTSSAGAGANGVKNPHPELNLTGWIAQGSTLVRTLWSTVPSMPKPPVGDYVFEARDATSTNSIAVLTADTSGDRITCAPGDTVQAAAYFWHNAGGDRNVRVDIQWHDAAGASLGQISGATVLIPSGEPSWTRVKHNETGIVAPANTASYRVKCYTLLSLGVVGDDTYCTCVQAQRNASNANPMWDYFDGSMVGFRWQGAAFASDSLLGYSSTRVRTQDWAANGTWSTRLTVTRHDGAFITGTTASQVDATSVADPLTYGLFPVTALNYYAARMKVRWRQGYASLLDARLYFFQSNAANATPNSRSGPDFPVGSITPGAVIDLIVVAQAPADAAVGELRIALNPTRNADGSAATGLAVVDMDVDSLAVYELDYTPAQVENSTLPEDVPAYGDGDSPFSWWTGTAHNSQSIVSETVLVGPFAPRVFNQDESGALWFWSSDDSVSFRAYRL